MISKFKELRLIITEINKYINNGSYNEAYFIAQKCLKDYPYSTELLILYLRLAQLSDQNDITLDEMKEQFSEIMKFQWYSHLDVIIDNIGIRHNVLDEKSEELESIFLSWHKTLINNMQEYMWLYFDYLSEIGKEWEINKIKNNMTLIIKNIPSNAMEDIDSL